MGNFVSQINTGPTACGKNPADYNATTNGQAMLALLVAFSVFSAWNLFCWAEMAWKRWRFMRKHRARSRGWRQANLRSTVSSRLLSPSSLAVLVAGVGSAVTLVTCFTQPIVTASYMISLAALNSATAWLTTHGAKEHLGLLPDAYAVGSSAYVVGVASSKYDWERANNPVPHMYMCLGVYAAVVLITLIADAATWIEKRRKQHKDTSYRLVVDADNMGSSTYLVLRERLMCLNFGTNGIKVLLILLLVGLANIVLIVKQAFAANNVRKYLGNQPLPTYNGVYKATPIVSTVALCINLITVVLIASDIFSAKMIAPSSPIPSPDDAENIKVA